MVIRRHFTALPPGGGVPLLRHSYALTLGLWQMSSTQASELQDGVEACPMIGFDYAEELARGLRALWRGTVGSRASRGSSTTRRRASPSRRPASVTS